MGVVSGGGKHLMEHTTGTHEMSRATDTEGPIVYYAPRSLVIMESKSQQSKT